jgi:hypothetical protein
MSVGFQLSSLRSLSGGALMERIVAFWAGEIREQGRTDCVNCALRAADWIRPAAYSGAGFIDQRRLPVDEHAFS